MNTMKRGRQKGSHKAKAIIFPGPDASPQNKLTIPSGISPETMVAEKDEVKRAEEKQRQRNKNK